MRNTIYVCTFEGNDLLNESFDFRDEAISWAKEHISERPVVKAVDFDLTEDYTTEVYEEEEIFHYPLKEQVGPEESEKESEDETIARLEKEAEELEDADLEGAALHRDYPEFESLNEALDLVAEIKKNPEFAGYRDATISKLINIYLEDVGVARKDAKPQDIIDWIIDPVQVLFDFSENFNGLEAVDIIMKDPAAIKACRDICDEYGVFEPIYSDQQEREPTDEEVVDYFIKEGTSVEDAINLVAERYSSVDSAEEDLDEDFYIFEPFSTDFSECEPMEVCADEHRADCSKDFCQGPADFLSELARELGIEDQVKIEPVECPDIPEVEEEDPEESEISETSKEEESEESAEETPAEEEPECPECEGEECEEEEKESVEESKEPEAVISAPGVKCDQELHYAEDGDNVNKEDKVITYDEDQKKDLKKLVEESHPSEAQPEVDNVKAYNAALKIAKEKGKPVIYGYHGSNKHGDHRYYEIEPIVCDDLKSCTSEVMKRYNPSGSVLVAYPDKDFAEGLNNCDLEDKMLFVEEDKEMSDIEFAEAFKKGLEEKHCCK